MIEPYYEKNGITIYHGDCREIMPDLGPFDLLLTDPPYGISLGKTKGSGGANGLRRDKYQTYEDTYKQFCAQIVPALEMALDKSDRAIVWTGPHIHEQRKPTAIGGVHVAAGAGRHGWGFKTFLPILLYGNAPDIHKGAPNPTTITSTEKAETFGHPCTKPIGWLQWCIKLGTREGHTVIDPFMGSGTTLVAAKLAGLKATGIEINKRYCEIAAKRLAQGVLAFNEATA